MDQYEGTENEWRAFCLVMAIIVMAVIFTVYGLFGYNSDEAKMNEYQVVERHETYNIVKKDSTYYIHTVRHGLNRVEELPMKPMRDSVPAVWVHKHYK